MEMGVKIVESARWWVPCITVGDLVSPVTFGKGRGGLHGGREDYGLG